MIGRAPARAMQHGDWLGLGLGALAIAILVGTIVVLDVVLIGALVAAPFVCALFARASMTALVGVGAIGAAVAAREWHMVEGEGFWLALAIIAGGTAFAAASAWNRGRSEVRGERLRILDAVATVADGSRPLDETLDVVTGMIVPRVADVCIVHALHSGGVSTAAVRAAGDPRAGEVEARLRDHPPPLPKWLIGGERTWAHIPRWRPRLSEEEVRRMARSEEDFEFLRSLGLRSALVVPIASRNRTLGALTLFSAWSHRRYTEDDVRFAQIAARRIGLALDNAGLFSDLESVERRMDTVMSILDEAVLIHSREGELVFANPAAARTLNFESPDELLAASSSELGERVLLRGETGRPLPAAVLTSGAAQDAGDEAALIVRLVDPATRHESWVRRRVQAIPGQEGAPLYVVTVLEDVTEVKRAEFAQSLLARTGKLLESSVDYWATLDAVARLVVPEFADWCAVNVPAPGGRIEQLAVAHTDEERARWARELRERYPVHVDDDGELVAEVIRTGEPRMLEVDAELVRATARDEEHLRLIESLQIRSAILAPMTAAGRVVGAVAFVNERESRTFGEADLEIAVELGRRAGLAVENARIAGERARVAEALQRELLPPDLPEMEGWEVATMYRPAGEMSEVGGDFYEAFALGDGWAVILGDVAGHGALAASLTAVARHTIRTATALSGDPALGLRVLDERLRERDAVALCSVAVLLLPQAKADDAVDVRVWLAGHPSPFLLKRGDPGEVGRQGPLAGIGEAPSWEPVTVRVAPGDQLVLYTDGIVEAKHSDGGRFGVDRLRDRLRSCDEPAATVAEVEAALVTSSDEEPEDDATVVAIRRAQAVSAAGAGAGGGAAATPAQPSA